MAADYVTKSRGKSATQRGAEADVAGFHRRLGPFVVAAETTRMPMVFTNAKERGNPIVFANDSFLRLTGYEREEVLGQGFSFLIAEGGDVRALSQMQAIFDGISDDDLEIHYQRKDGSEFWASLFISPVRNGVGEIVQHFISLVDLTKKHQEKVRATMFIDELNHRVKNTLATVYSIIWQAFRSEVTIPNIRDAIESRLFALSRSHDLLTSAEWEGVGLRELLDTVLEPFAGGSGQVSRIQITGSDLLLLPNTTLALAIAFHELATNAVKYGALSNDSGSVLISWQVQLDGETIRLVLTWCERDGPPVEAPTHKGFGTDVLERGLAHELEGEVQLMFRPEGLVCKIDIPTPDIPFA